MDSEKNNQNLVRNNIVFRFTSNNKKNLIVQTESKMTFKSIDNNKETSIQSSKTSISKKKTQKIAKSFSPKTAKRTASAAKSSANISRKYGRDRLSKTRLPE